MSSLLVFNRVHRLEIQSVMLLVYLPKRDVAGLSAQAAGLPLTVRVLTFQHLKHYAQVFLTPAIRIHPRNLQYLRTLFGIRAETRFLKPKI
jgi:hypothetical protein